MAWIDCGAGASGDMFLGALVDAGVELATLQRAVSALGTEPIELRARPVERHHLGATKVDVVAHDHAAHRTWREVRRLLDAADLEDPVRALAQNAFARLARAEARVHRVEPEAVHFHEVGALDAIADIVGTAAGFHALRLSEVTASVVTLGSGRAWGAHGGIPVPGPATLLILAEAEAPCVAGPAQAEMCTPTGAALVAALATRFDGMPRMCPIVVGQGAGTRDTPEQPNLLRLVIGQRVGAKGTPRLREDAPSITMDRSRDA